MMGEEKPVQNGVAIHVSSVLVIVEEGWISYVTQRKEKIKGESLFPLLFFSHPFLDG